MDWDFQVLKTQKEIEGGATTQALSSLLNLVLSLRSEMVQGVTQSVVSEVEREIENMSREPAGGVDELDLLRTVVDAFITAEEADTSSRESLRIDAYRLAKEWDKKYRSP